MNKQQLASIFPNFSFTAFRKPADQPGYELTGLYVRVMPPEELGFPDEWDVWICNARTMDRGRLVWWLEENRERLGIKKRRIGGKGTYGSLVRLRNAVSRKLRPSVHA